MESAYKMRSRGLRNDNRIGAGDRWALFSFLNLEIERVTSDSQLHAKVRKAASLIWLFPGQMQPTIQLPLLKRNGA